MVAYPESDFEYVRMVKESTEVVDDSVKYLEALPFLFGDLADAIGASTGGDGDSDSADGESGESGSGGGSGSSSPILEVPQDGLDGYEIPLSFSYDTSQYECCGSTCECLA